MSHIPALTTSAPVKPLKVEELTDHFPALRHIVGARKVYLLRADLAGPSGSFKDFGVENAIKKLVVAGYKEASTASAGSHALAMLKPLADHGMKAHMLLPVIASSEKQRKMRQLWHSLGQDPNDLTIRLVGSDLEETLEYVRAHVDPATFVHAYDNVGVIKGRRAIHDAALHAVPELTDMIVPVGGGSLFTALTLCGSTWGVEAEGSDSLSKSLRAESLTPLRASSPNDKFGGCTVRFTGENVLKLLQPFEEAAHKIVTATNDEVRKVAQSYLAYAPDNTLEPTSLVAVAGLPHVLSRLPDTAVVGVIATGHNESYKNLLQD